MKRLIRITAAAAAAAVAVALGLLFLTPTTAGASPSGETLVPGTQCTLTQVENAIEALAPELANRLDSNPTAKDRFEDFVVKPEKERQAIIAKAKIQHPRLRGDHPKVRDAVNEVKNTCGQY